MIADLIIEVRLQTGLGWLSPPGKDRKGTTSEGLCIENTRKGNKFVRKSRRYRNIIIYKDV